VKRYTDGEQQLYAIRKKIWRDKWEISGKFPGMMMIYRELPRFMAARAGGIVPDGKKYL